MREKLALGVSSCLLGQEVRFDRGFLDKLQRSFVHCHSLKRLSQRTKSTSAALIRVALSREALQR